MSWDAASYDVVSDPHVQWAEAVLERLPLHGGETVLDAGCGSGRVTELLVDRLPHGRVIAVDGDANMVSATRERFAANVRVDVLHQDLLELHPPNPVDAVFSNAVFHWVPDHDALFRALHRALRPGGRLVAQCGGHGNIAKVREISGPGPWLYATGEETEERLRAAGFGEAKAWLEPWPVVPPEPRRFLSTVCLRTMPDDKREAAVERILAELGDPPTLDYVRLNIVAIA